MKARAFPLALVLFLAACEADRYRWNLSHAEVARSGSVPQSDFEQIVRVLSHAANEPVLIIYPEPPGTKHPTKVNAMTGTSLSTHIFAFRKGQSSWHIVSESEPEIY
jgi:hypothetical protein